MKIWIMGDLFDSEIIAYVRKLRKRTKGFELEGGGKIPSSDYVVALKQGYSLGGEGGKKAAIFLSQEEGKKVLAQFKESASADVPDTTQSTT